MIAQKASGVSVEGEPELQPSGKRKAQVALSKGILIISLCWVRATRGETAARLLRGQH